MIVDGSCGNRAHTEAVALDGALHALHLNPEIHLKNGNVVVTFTPGEARALLQELERH